MPPRPQPGTGAVSGSKKSTGERICTPVCPVACPNPTGDLRPFAERTPRDSGISGQFAVRAENFQSVAIVIIQDRFLSNTTIAWNSASRRLIATRSGLEWRKLLAKIHTRGGFEMPGFLWNL